MKTSDCYLLGSVIKPHGLAGNLSVFFDVDDPSLYHNLSVIWVSLDGILIPYRITDLNLRLNKTIMRLEGINSIEEASKLAKAKLYLPLTKLPKLKKGDFYLHELVDCEVWENNKKLGTIKNIVDMSKNCLASVMVDDKEVLIPIQPEIVKLVDTVNKRVDVKLPDGLLDIYLEE